MRNILKLIILLSLFSCGFNTTQKSHELIQPNRSLISPKDIGFNNFNIKADLKEQEIYKVPFKKLPAKLKGKVKKLFIFRPLMFMSIAMIKLEKQKEKNNEQ